MNGQFKKWTLKDLDLKFGDFIDEFHTAQAFVESDSNSAMLVGIIDDKRASIGIEDIDNTEWSENSFNKGTRDSRWRYYYVIITS